MNQLEPLWSQTEDIPKMSDSTSKRYRSKAMAMSLIRTTTTLPINPGTADLISCSITASIRPQHFSTLAATGRIAIQPPG